MQIFVKYLTTHTFDVSNNTTGDELKNMVSERINIPIEYLYLIYSSKIVSDKVLSDYNIKELSRLDVMLRHC
jgi:hypothetical protein